VRCHPIREAPKLRFFRSNGFHCSLLRIKTLCVRWGVLTVKIYICCFALHLLNICWYNNNPKTEKNVYAMHSVSKQVPDIFDNYDVQFLHRRLTKEGLKTLDHLKKLTIQYASKQNSKIHWTVIWQQTLPTVGYYNKYIQRAVADEIIASVDGIENAMQVSFQVYCKCCFGQDVDGHVNSIEGTVPLFHEFYHFFLTRLCTDPAVIRLQVFESHEVLQTAVKHAILDALRDSAVDNVRIVDTETSEVSTMSHSVYKEESPSETSLYIEETKTEKQPKKTFQISSKTESEQATRRRDVSEKGSRISKVCSRMDKRDAATDVETRTNKDVHETERHASRPSASCVTSNLPQAQEWMRHLKQPSNTLSPPKPTTNHSGPYSGPYLGPDDSASSVHSIGIKHQSEQIKQMRHFIKQPSVLSGSGTRIKDASVIRPSPIRRIRMDSQSVLFPSKGSPKTYDSRTML
jgi:hypothetical protein